ncbi:MAG: cation-translocating P-type ATPase [Bradyrhizobiaceae bacterium]|nr:cation-translocating P-type ATPase [Bradyrhizobiaceae bacterium]
MDGAIDGLSETDAQTRLKNEGYNELPASERRTTLRIVFDVVREPMLALLLVGVIVYLALGNLQDALVLAAFATMSIVITAVQERRTERALEALRNLTSPRALVIRDGHPSRIAGREVVRGDIIVLAEGDRVPADALLIRSQDLQIDESLLTGESVPVRKTSGDKAATDVPGRPGGDDLPFVFSGSLVVRGAGTGEVLATGPRSEIGRLGQSLGALEREPPRLQQQTQRVVWVFAVAGGAVSVLAILLYGVLRGGWLDAALGGLALGMSMLPEEFPVVLAVFMAMGAWRISRARVLTRRAAAIETLGSATVLCTDKTGTLTENRMSISEIRLRSGQVFRPREQAPTSMAPEFRDVVEFGVLASARDPFDPMERAFHELACTRSFAMERLDRPEWKLVHTYGLRPDLLAVTQAWQVGNYEQNFVIAAKGAPEAVCDLCHLSPADLTHVTRAVDLMAAEGLRMLGVARASYAGEVLPVSPHDFAFEFLGLVGLADPLRPSVHAAMDDCRSAGIKVVMITGDYPATARAIARIAGIDAADLVTGDELERFGDLELALRVRDATIFARTMPEQKLRIVNALKANGQIVAMTGDGVNDAPSLKAAHIGIAMGRRGTDVAREASSIVILDDDFGSIVKAVRLGRRIYDNIRKAMGFIFAVHVPIAGVALLPLPFGLPILLGPVHIAFLEMIIDPVCSLVFEAEKEEDDVMRRLPRDPDEPLFSRVLVGWGILQGSLALTLITAILAIAIGRGMPEDEIRAAVFFSLVTSILGLVFVNRSFSKSLAAAIGRPNTALLFILPLVTATLGLTLLWAPARGLFRFGPLHLDDLVLTIGVGVILVMLLECLKPITAGQRCS